MSGPAAPMAWLSRPASGTSVAARGPRTPIVAIARPRYSAVVTARAMATTRGSCRRGLAKRVVSGATASQPTNENISVAAALPTDSQPCGANGAQLPARSAPAEPVAATIVAATGSAGAERAGNWAPFAPHGWLSVGSAAPTLMFSFVGWEAVAPLTTRFADPRRQ